MLTDQQQRFLDEPHYAIVGTLNGNGTIQQTVIWYLREGAELRFSLSAQSVKARNLRRNPNVTLTIEDGARYLTITGLASVEDADPALRRRLAERYLAAERVAAWLQQPARHERASVRITIQRVYGQGV